jgi:Domain of unknown function (DUF4351)
LASRLDREDLVYRGAMEVALFEGVVAVKDEGDMVAVVEIAFCRYSTGNGSVGVDAFGDAAVEGIIRVIDLTGDGAASGGANQDAGEAVAVIPGVFGDFNGSNVGTTGAVTFVVVGIVVDPVTQQLVVAASLVAGMLGTTLQETRVYQDAKAEGRQEGEQIGAQREAADLILRQLAHRFGPLAPALHTRIEQLPLERLETLGVAWLDWQGVDELEGWLENQ